MHGTGDGPAVGGEVGDVEGAADSADGARLGGIVRWSHRHGQSAAVCGTLTQSAMVTTYAQ